VIEVEEDVGNGYPQQCFVDGYDVFFVRPAPLPFPLTFNVHKEVRDLVVKFSESYWADPETAANKLRQAIEVLLTDQKVPRTVINKHNKRQALSLHARIEKYRKINPSVATLLLAIKWLGNEGSHPGSLIHKDVLDGYELFEHIIDKVYNKTRSRLTGLANSINRNKGPVKPKRQRRK